MMMILLNQQPRRQFWDISPKPCQSLRTHIFTESKYLHLSPTPSGWMKPLLLFRPASYAFVPFCTAINVRAKTNTFEAVAYAHGELDIYNGLFQDPYTAKIFLRGK